MTDSVVAALRAKLAKANEEIAALKDRLERATAHSKPLNFQGIAAVSVSVVEDNPDIRELFAASLEEAGYQVLEANSGAELVLRPESFFFFNLDS